MLEFYGMEILDLKTGKVNSNIILKQKFICLPY